MRGNSEPIYQVLNITYLYVSYVRTYEDDMIVTIKAIICDFFYCPNLLKTTYVKVALPSDSSWIYIHILSARIRIKNKPPKCNGFNTLGQWRKMKTMVLNISHTIITKFWTKRQLLLHKNSEGFIFFTFSPSKEAQEINYNPSQNIQRWTQECMLHHLLKTSTKALQHKLKENGDCLYEKCEGKAILLKAGGFIWHMSGSTPYSIPLKPLFAEILKYVCFKLVFMIMQG